MKLDRKKFFLSAAAGLAGIALFNKFPFSFLARESKSANSKISVKINPMAVSRGSEKGKNA
jgi:hypothetical protein